MKLSTLQALCDYFDVPLDYLAKDSYEEIREALGSNSPAAKKLREIGESLSAPSLSSPDESELISIFRTLNHKGQDMLINTARSLATNPDMKKAGESNTETA